MARKLRATHRVMFMGECPSIGSGWRGVHLEKVGRKWAYFIEVSTLTRVRVKKAVWEGLGAVPVEEKRKRHGKVGEQTGQPKAP